jgi:hypothetical protein
MKRIHLFEFEDLSWFPVFLRNYMTDFLQFISNRFDVYKNIVPMLERILRNTGSNRIIDLASGGGGGLVKLSEQLSEKIPGLRIMLTDFYPNIRAFERTAGLSPVFEYTEQPVNAMQVPPHLNGLRTQFLSLHHFRPQQAVQILQNAVDSQSPIALFEAQERNLKSILSMVFSPISVLLTTPFIRPFSAGRLIFTYLIPLVPLFVMWDGIVSALRTYTVAEMEELVSQVQGHADFTWEIGRVQSGPTSNPYLIGYPQKNKAEKTVF